jgi:uncharacterized protein (TIGR02466 family)
MIIDTKFPGLKRDLLFPTPIYIKELEGTKELNKQLFKNIKVMMKKDPKGLAYTNVNGWHSQTDLNHKSEFNPLTEQVFTMVNQIFEDYGIAPKSGLGNMWANVNYPGSYNKQHMHPNTLIAGAYYVKIPADDSKSHIWIEDPRPGPNIVMPRRLDNLPKELWRTVVYPPKEGLIYLFPGWLSHGTEMNRSKLKGEKGWRISIAFNFIQTL